MRHYSIAIPVVILSVLLSIVVTGGLQAQERGGGTDFRERNNCTEAALYLAAPGVVVRSVPQRLQPMRFVK